MIRNFLNIRFGQERTMNEVWFNNSIILENSYCKKGNQPEKCCCTRRQKRTIPAHSFKQTSLSQFKKNSLIMSTQSYFRHQFHETLQRRSQMFTVSCRPMNTKNFLLPHLMLIACTRSLMDEKMKSVKSGGYGRNKKDFCEKHKEETKAAAADNGVVESNTIPHISHMKNILFAFFYQCWGVNQ